MANERHSDVRLWEPDYSTRQSAHPHTKYYPFRQTTATTAATLLTVGQGEIAVNLVPNPGMELAMVTGDASGYVAVGAAIERKTTPTPVSGTYVMEVDPVNSAVGEGFYWTTPPIPLKVEAQILTAQIKHQGASVASAVKLEIRAADGTTVLATSGNSNLATSWVGPITATYIVPANTATALYRVYMTTVTNHNITFSVDEFMVEVRDDTQAVSTYLDGDRGVNYEWSGPANASSSRKRPAMETIRGITIKNEDGAAIIVYVAFDTTATATTGIPVLAGATFENAWPLGFHQKVSVVSASGTPYVSGVIWGV